VQVRRQRDVEAVLTAADEEITLHIFVSVSVDFGQVGYKRGRDTEASITSRILVMSVGLSIASVAPAARACSRSFSPKDVIATTGKSANSSFDLTATIKSKPLRTGIAMSVTIRSGRFTCISANASRPFRTAFTL